MDDRAAGMIDLDRVLVEALDVDVSADFVPRVRQRVAREPKPRAFWRPSRVVLAAVAAVVMAAIGLTTMLSRNPSRVPVLPARALPVVQVHPVQIEPTHQVVLSNTSRVVGRVRMVAAASSAQRQPEVLVPREDIEMYRRLIAAAQRVPNAVLVHAPEESVAQRSISEITIDPIRIDTIVPPVGGEGERR